ncbi:MAG: MMPL family transporter [bacterium]|nr:MMPL family transporter [bacterium]
MSDPQVNLRQRIEDWLGGWAHVVSRLRWPVLVCVLLATGYLGTFIPSMEIKTASEDFLFEDDPVRARYDAFKAEFGQDQIMTLAISPPEIFDLEFLGKLRAFHVDLEDEVPFLEDLTSLVNVRTTYGRGDELVVEDLLDEMPETQTELAVLRERVLSTPFYFKSGVLSDDGRATSVRVEVAVYGAADEDSAGVSEEGPADFADLGGFEDDSGLGAASGKRPFLSGKENALLIETIHEIVERHSGPDFPVSTAGGSMMTYEFTKQVGRDVPLFFGGGLAVIGLVLVVLFRRLSAMLLCFAVVIPATISTFGVSAAFGIPFSAPAQLIPSFLLAIGVSYSVHLVTIFLADLSEGRDRVQSLEHALRHSGLPILMTGITTSAGLLSFLVAEMKPIQEMGLISSIGVAVMLFYAMVLLPTMLAILPIKGRVARRHTPVDRVLGFLAATSARHPWKILGVTGVLFLFAIASVSQLRMSSNPVSWFPEDHAYAISADFMNRRFGGMFAVEVVVDTGREDGLKEPEVMRRLEAIEGLVERFKEEGAKLSHTNSVVDIIRETHQALNANAADFYVVPDDRRLLAQEMLLFENSGSDDLEKVVDSQFSRARYTVRSSWMDGVYMAPFLAEFGPAVEELVGDVARVEITGMSALIARTIDAMLASMLKSYGLALCLITPLMILLIGSLRSGLISMVPNLVPILMTMGMMGATGIPLDMFTLLSGCIAIGLAVDDSIHFISGFRRYLAEGQDPVQAVASTMQSTGRALLFTSIVLISGFAVLLLSEMLNMRNVGGLTTFAIAAAFLLDVTVTPALLVLTHRRKADLSQPIEGDDVLAA